MRFPLRFAALPPQGEGDTATTADLVVDARQVAFDGAWADAERVGHVLVARAARDQPRHLAFRLGEAVLLPIQGLPPGISLPPQGDLFLEPGSYTIPGTASPDVGAFSVSFQLAAAVEWTNQPSAQAALNLAIPRTW